MATVSEQQGALAEALRLLTALEGSIVEVAAGLSKETKPEMAAVKAEILASLWKDGNAALMRVEAIYGPHPRRGPFTEAYATAMSTVNRLREAAVPKPAALDMTMAGQPSRADHLPRIELPRFNGSPSEWPAFSSRFEKRVANLGEDADRYAFLAKCLERCDIARHSCEAFENAGMPFAQAWVKLEERFYKKRVAFSGHIRRIIDLPHVTSASANALMRIIDVVETSLASARQIAEADDSTSVVEDGLVVALVMGKLDADTIASITRRADPQSIPTWVELRNELDKLANRMYYQPKRKEEAAAKPHRDRNPPQRGARTVLAATVVPVAGPESKRDSHTVPAATRTGEPARSKGEEKKVRVRTAGERRCYGCDRTGHITITCPELRARSNIQSIEYIMEKRKCTNCFSGDHRAASCPSEKRCQVCGKKHHTMLHVHSEPQ